jgi:hypothetical protein
MLQVDKKTVDLGMAPKWFGKFRGAMFGVYMALSATLFAIYYARAEQI